METLKIGWIGTGVMGHSMCGHLLAAGCEAAVFNRSRSKAVELLKKGARWCDSPAEVAAASDVVFTIVGFPADVQQVILGPEGVLAGCRAGMVLVDMTTSSPRLAEKISAAAAERRVSALDAPVSGGDIGARDATLAIMVGGRRETFDQVRPLFEHLGKNIAYMGGAGSGQHTKMCNQILVAGTIIGTVESLLYAVRAGLGPDAVIEVIGKGAASSWTINVLGPRIAAGNFDPGFYIKHFIKDMGIVLEEARRMNLALPGLALVHQLYIAAAAMGYENLGTHGLYKALENINSGRGSQAGPS